jgi:hypothetical protein
MTVYKWSMVLLSQSLTLGTPVNDSSLGKKPFICTLRNGTFRDLIFLRLYSFPSCHDQDATQEQIFDKDVRPLLDMVFQGIVSFTKANTMPSK